MAIHRLRPYQDGNLFNVAEVQRAFRLLFEAGQVVELRALDAALVGNGRYTATYGGYFNNCDDLLLSLETIERAKGIYITLQVCNPALLHRAKNKLIRQGKDSSTSDKDILRYRWLLIDSDVERVAGISSTEEEHEAALAHSQNIKNALSALGWPSPVEADSGNGAHLLYRVDLPASDSGLVKRVLEGLAAKYDSMGIHVDQVVFNPARICKLYGSLVCKGDNTTERPHRLSRLLEVPEHVEVVTREQLEAIATPAQEQPVSLSAYQLAKKQLVRPIGAKKEFSLEDFLNEHGIKYLSKDPYNGGTRYHLEVCAWNAAHTDNSACVYQFADGRLAASCNHNSCKGKGWKEFRQVFDRQYDPNATYETRLERDLSTALQRVNSLQKQHYDRKPPHTLSPWSVETKKILEYLGKNEYGDALLFAQAFDGQVVYDHTEKEWYLWAGHHWRKDTTKKIQVLIAGVLGTIYLQASADLNVQFAEIEQKIALLSAQAGTNPEILREVDALKDQYKRVKGDMGKIAERVRDLRGAGRNKRVQEFIQSEMGVTSDQWDTNPWLLAVPNGVIDLHTGECRDGQPEDYIKTVCPTEWMGLDTPCPRFETFLQEIFEEKGKDRDSLIGFLHRYFGYGITGLVNVAMFLILYGEEGRNGKDTLLGVLKEVLGPISGAISNDVFVSNDKNRTGGAATPHLCDLQGKRLVWGSETRQGDRLNIAQLKHITGGGDIPARQLYGKQYTFPPTHKLLLMTNYKPHADAKDKAFWARVCLIEFGLRFVANPQAMNERKVDIHLKERLQQEASGILAWLVRGCLLWQKTGIPMPDIVQIATEKYRDDEDRILQFIKDCCVTHPDATSMGGELYTAYKEWCKANEIKPTNGKQFGEDISRTYEKKRKIKGYEYAGIAVYDENTTPPDWLQPQEENIVNLPGQANDDEEII